LIFKRVLIELRITVRFYGIVFDNTNVREWSPEIKDAVTISELLTIIVENYPSLNDLVFDTDGLIRDYLVFSVNNEDIQGLNGIDTILEDGDTVFVMPPIGGG
jgi:MoaD family protein